MIIDTLIDKIIEFQNPTCIGLDSRLEYLPKKYLKKFNAYEEGFKGAAQRIYQFNKDIIDAVCGIIPCVKIQSAYYELYGYQGMKIFYKTIKYARKCGMIVIADVKRGDIGSTSLAYANAYLGVTPKINRPAFPCDFITVNPYIGTDCVMPFVNLCEENDKGIFILVKTSNPSSKDIQDIIGWNEPVYKTVGDFVEYWGSSCVGNYGYSNVAAVIGATNPREAFELRSKLKSVFFLIPGYGAQGATGKDLGNFFDSNGLGGIVNASRSLICACKLDEYSKFDHIDAVRSAALDMKADILSSLNSFNKPLQKIKGSV